MKKTIVMTVAALALLLVCCLFLRSADRTEPIRPRKVGVVLYGSKDNLCGSQALYEAVSAVCGGEGVAVSVQEQVPADGDFLAAAERLIAAGCGLILCDSYLYAPYLADLAAAHPDTFFLNTNSTECGRNYASCMGRLYQARYLTGLAAGMQTRTGEIGYVLACLTPETIRQLNAFAIGVRKANPDAVVYVRRTNDWNDGEKAALVTGTLLDSHRIDVLAFHTNTFSPLSAAEEAGISTIGSGCDASALFPASCLTSAVFHWEPLLEERIRDYLEGRFDASAEWGSIRSGAVGVAPLSEQVGEEARALVEREAQRLRQGEFDVFFGPIRDTFGVVQVRADENLSDERLQHGMYWFVDGVVME